MMFETILVPLDGSALAETAVPYAAELARLTGATLVVLRVVEETRPIFDAACRDIIWIDPANPRLELLAPAILEPALSALRERGLAVSPVVRLGDPRQEIVAEARQHPRPVIVLASHGRGGLSRAVLGSVATRVLQLSPCPVLVVRARDSEARPAEPRFSAIVVPLDG
ncbi:MAG: universal stress protein, partial [Thermomicrobiaceae bacterium]|nr:universal stress protein [Thermomicrobiaceae bacterium]